MKKQVVFILIMLVALFTINITPAKAATSGREFLATLNSEYDPRDYDGIPAGYYGLFNYDEIIEKSLEIVKNCRTDEEKVKAIYDWIAQNLHNDYDMDVCTPGFAYSLRRGDCEGYSNLTRFMYGAVNIPCLVLYGTSKPDGIAHAWNAVWLNNSWHLMDVTWDSHNQYYGEDDPRNISGRPATYNYYLIDADEFEQSHNSEHVDDYNNWYYSIQSIRLAGDVKTEYNIGDSFYESKVEGVTATGKIVDLSDTIHSVDIFNKRANFSGYDMNTEGTQTVKVTAGKFSLTYQITVKKKTSNTANDSTNTGTASKKPGNTVVSTYTYTYNYGSSTSNTAIKLSSVKSKKNTKKITGKVSVSGATVKIKVGRKAYSYASVNGKKFKLKLSYKLKKKTKIKVVVSKYGFSTIKKTYVVK